MATSNRDRYRNAMREHGFGYALYEPQRSQDLRPGMLGYFDNDRQWHPLLDLTDAAAVAAHDCKPFKAPTLRRPDSRRWDPIKSTGMFENDVTLDAGFDATSFGLPVTTKIMTEYTSKSDFGAVLVCNGDVVVEGYDVRKPFERWMVENKDALAKIPELREHGIVCATWTYSSRDISLNVTHNANTVVRVGCTAGAGGIANASAGGSWLRGRSGGLWSEWADGQRAVFFTGVKCVYRWLGRMGEHPEPEWRGGPKFIVWNRETQDAYEGEVGDFE